MTWINDTQKALQYIENNLLRELSPDDIASHVCTAEHHFQRIFGIVTGYSVMEYVRLRRLSKAGQELRDSQSKVIDIAYKYGYDSPESFTKAFVRFHEMTPSEAKKGDKALKIFAPITVEMKLKGGFVMARKMIPNIERLYEKKTENYMFPSCMRSVMCALQENPDFDFLFFAGVTGDLFTQLWVNPKWQYNDSYSQTCHQTLDPIRKAFLACGYDFEYIPKAEIQKDRPKYLQRIIESIDRGIPILTFGIVGPPVCSIIFGYDENGDVLIGWSQFTDEPHPDNDGPHMECISENYFQKRNGLDHSDALIFIGDKKYTPSIADGIRKSILAISSYADFAEIDGWNSQSIVFGQEAFDAWADSLLDDSCFMSECMLDSPLDTYMSCIVQIGTNMHYMQEYLNRAYTLCPDLSALIEELRKAYRKVSDAFMKVTEFQGGYFFEKDRNALLQKDFRVKLSELIRKLGVQYGNVAEVVKSYVKINNI